MQIIYATITTSNGRRRAEHPARLCTVRVAPGELLALAKLLACEAAAAAALSNYERADKLASRAHDLQRKAGR